MHFAHEAGHGDFRADFPGQAQRAVGHAVVGAVKRQDRAAAGSGLHQLQRRLHGVGSRRPAELDSSVGGEVRRQAREQFLHESVLHRRGQIQGLERRAVRQQLLNRLHHHRVVMPQGQGAGSRQAIDVAASVGVLHVDAPALLQASGKRRG